jgi:hypothetical protein
MNSEYNLFIDSPLLDGSLGILVPRRRDMVGLDFEVLFLLGV